MSKVIYPPESVYNLIPNEEVQIQKAPRPAVVLENKSSKDVMRTMGPAKEEVPSPDKYLKRHSKEPSQNTALERHPLHCEETTSSCKDIQHNNEDSHQEGLCKDGCSSADEATAYKCGLKQLLENSGLVPMYIMKKDYGEVPEYLRQRIKEERRAQEEFNNFVKEQQVG